MGIFPEAPPHDYYSMKLHKGGGAFSLIVLMEQLLTQQDISNVILGQQETFT